MEMQYVDRIFQMFQRLHEVGRFEGSGIGLAIVREFICAHHGSVRALPNERGAHFRIELPHA